MVRVKMMNENTFSSMENELRALGELIKTRQDEKQGVLNEFDLELKRYKDGKISENTLESSVKKTNKELEKLDGSIKNCIKKILFLSKKMDVFVKKQEPIHYKVNKSGISGAFESKAKKRVESKKISSKKPMGKKTKGKITKAEIAKEMKLEKKLIK